MGELSQILLYGIVYPGTRTQIELCPGPYFWKISQEKLLLTTSLGRTIYIIQGCQGRKKWMMKEEMGETIREAREVPPKMGNMSKSNSNSE